MAIRETERSAAVKFRRTYRCDDCLLEWRVQVDTIDAPVDDCPVCAAKAREEMPMPALGTNKGRAVDLAQKIAEEDFGLTNMRDNQREGDTAMIGPSAMQTAERETITRELMALAQQTKAEGQAMAPEVEAAVENLANPGGFWQNQPMTTGEMITQAKPFQDQQKAEGIDPVRMLQDGVSGAGLQPKYRVIARDKMPAAAA